MKDVAKQLEQHFSGRVKVSALLHPLGNMLAISWLSLRGSVLRALCFFSPDGGDKDARDLMQMRLEQRLRDGLEDESIAGQRIGTFEKYTKVRLKVSCYSVAVQETSEGGVVRA